jgi:hypothetical protein
VKRTSTALRRRMDALCLLWCWAADAGSYNASDGTMLKRRPYEARHA